jgi:hypothetical protein
MSVCLQLGVTLSIVTLSLSFYLEYGDILGRLFVQRSLTSRLKATTYFVTQRVAKTIGHMTQPRIKVYCQIWVLSKNQ